MRKKVIRFLTGITGVMLIFQLAIPLGSSYSEEDEALSPRSKVGLKVDGSRIDASTEVPEEMLASGFLLVLESLFTKQQQEPTISGLKKITEDLINLNMAQNAYALATNSWDGKPRNHIAFRLPNGSIMWFHEGTQTDLNPPANILGKSIIWSNLGGLSWALYRPTEPVNEILEEHASKVWFADVQGGKRVVVARAGKNKPFEAMDLAQAAQISVRPSSGNPPFVGGVWANSRRLALDTSSNAVAAVTAVTASQPVVPAAVTASVTATSLSINPSQNATATSADANTNTPTTSVQQITTGQTSQAGQIAPNLLTGIGRSPGGKVPSPQSISPWLVPSDQSGINSGQGPAPLYLNAANNPDRNGMGRTNNLPVVVGGRIIGSGGPGTLPEQLIQLQMDLARLRQEREDLERLRRNELLDGSDPTKATSATRVQELKVHELNVYITSRIATLQQLAEREEELSRMLQKLADALNVQQSSSDALYRLRGEMLRSVAEQSPITPGAARLIDAFEQRQREVRTIAGDLQDAAMALHKVVPPYIALNLVPGAGRLAQAGNIGEMLVQGNAIPDVRMDSATLSRLADVLGRLLNAGDNPVVERMLQRYLTDTTDTAIVYQDGLQGQYVVSRRLLPDGKTENGDVLTGPSEIRIGLEMLRAIASAEQDLHQKDGFSTTQAGQAADLFRALDILGKMILAELGPILADRTTESVYMQTVFAALFVNGLTDEEFRLLSEFSASVDAYLRSQGIESGGETRKGQIDMLRKLDLAKLEGLLLMEPNGMKWLQREMLPQLENIQGPQGRFLPSPSAGLKQAKDNAQAQILKANILRAMDKKLNARGIGAKILLARLNKKQPGDSGKANELANLKDIFSARRQGAAWLRKLGITDASKKRRPVMQLPGADLQAADVEIAIDISLLAELRMREDGTYQPLPRNGQRLGAFAARDLLVRLIGKDLSEISDALKGVRVHVLIGDKIKEEDARAVLGDLQTGFIARDVRDLLVKIRELRLALGNPASQSESHQIEINTFLVLNRDNVEKLAAQPAWDLKDIRTNFDIFVVLASPDDINNPAFIASAVLNPQRLPSSPGSRSLNESLSAVDGFGVNL